MSNKTWFEEPEEIVAQCDDCVHPNGCIRECAIKNHVDEDVAAIRGEVQ